MCKFANQWKTGDSLSLINLTYGHSFFRNKKIIIIIFFGLGVVIEINNSPKPPAVKDVLREWEKENGIT